MSGKSKTGRELGRVGEGLTRWLESRYPENGKVTLKSLQVPSSGYSSETVLLDVEWERPSVIPSQLVARLPPSDDGLFPVYDLKAQGGAQSLLHAAGIPVAAPLAYEPDSSWVGAHFLLMPMVPGRVVPDMHHVDGWLKELAPDSQRRNFERYLDTLAKLHRLDWRAAGLAFAARVPASANFLRDEFEWWRSYLKWIGRRRESDIQEIVSIYDWLRDHWPKDEPPASFIWGDARTGNVVYRDNQEVAALLDFEMMSIAPAEVDVGWWMALRRQVTCDRLPELPGYRSHDETLSMYEERLGRKLSHFTWYELFGAARIAASSFGLFALLKERGQLAPETALWVFVPEWARRIMQGGKSKR